MGWRKNACVGWNRTELKFVCLHVCVCVCVCVSHHDVTRIALLDVAFGLGTYMYACIRMCPLVHYFLLITITTGPPQDCQTLS